MHYNTITQKTYFIGSHMTSTGIFFEMAKLQVVFPYYDSNKDS